MNKHTINWSHKWFGFWKEYGDRYAEYPSIFDFVDKEKNSSYDKDRLKHYLENGIGVVSTSKINFPNPFTGKPGSGAVSWVTDGTWVWFDDLPDYIDHHDLSVPDQFYEHIKRNNFQIPAIENVDFNSLDMP